MGLLKKVTSAVSNAVQSVAAPVVEAVKELPKNPVKSVQNLGDAYVSGMLQTYKTGAQAIDAVPVVGDLARPTNQSLSGGISGAQSALQDLIRLKKPSDLAVSQLYGAASTVQKLSGGGVVGGLGDIGIPDFGGIFTDFFNKAGSSFGQNPQGELDTGFVYDQIQNGASNFQATRPKLNTTGLIFLGVAALGALYLLRRK